MSAPLGRTPGGGGGGGLRPWPWIWLIVGVVLVVGALTWQPWRLVKWPPKQGTTISGPKKPGKVAKPLTPAEQLRKERAARRSAEAKVRELRKALRAKAKVRRPATTPIQRHEHVHKGTVRLEFVAPTYPIIPEPARR